MAHTLPNLLWAGTSLALWRGLGSERASCTHAHAPPPLPFSFVVATKNGQQQQQQQQCEKEEKRADEASQPCQVGQSR